MSKPCPVCEARIAADSRLLCRTVEKGNDPQCVAAVSQIARDHLARQKENPMKLDASFTIRDDAELSVVRRFLPKFAYGSKEYMMISREIMAYDHRKLQAGRQVTPAPKPKTKADFAREQAAEDYVRRLCDYSTM